MSDETGKNTKTDSGALDPAGQTFLPGELVTGYEAFRSGRFQTEQDRFKELAEHGQKPHTLVIGCVDSRVSPEAIFNAGPGEIFVLRNVANLVPPYAPNDDLHGTSAAIEFAVIGLEVKHIVVMGHGQCGGIKAYAQGAGFGHAPLSSGDFIGKWVSLIAPAAVRLGPPGEATSGYIEKLAWQSVIQSLTNLRGFPFVAEREAEGKLHLHGAYFSIADGVLLALDEATGAFLPVA